MSVLVLLVEKSVQTYLFEDIFHVLQGLPGFTKFPFGLLQNDKINHIKKHVCEFLEQCSITEIQKKIQ